MAKILHFRRLLKWSIAITVGTKIKDTLSAAFAMGAFVAAASLTILIICESVVSSPIRVALHVKKMLESYSKGKTTDALKGLMKLAPKTATILVDNVETEVSISILGAP